MAARKLQLKDKLRQYSVAIGTVPPHSSGRSCIRFVTPNDRTLIVVKHTKPEENRCERLLEGILSHRIGDNIPFFGCKCRDSHSL